jgi:Co/Zn/Cd efflux system component
MHAKKPARKAGRDLGMFGVLLHVIGDAINNIGVMISAGAIWGAKSDSKYYADPAVSMAIAFMILGTSIPLSMSRPRKRLSLYSDIRPSEAQRQNTSPKRTFWGVCRRGQAGSRAGTID